MDVADAVLKPTNPSGNVNEEFKAALVAAQRTPSKTAKLVEWCRTAAALPQ